MRKCVFINRAEKYHLNIAVLPTWGDKLYKNTWGAGPEVFNDNNAAIFAAWLARRYKSRTNIIWLGNLYAYWYNPRDG
ncbi:DUF4038 domain-containing protein [Mucilaginibacter sp.]|uniref:apiosidase-like domain-containing protein n=1 Tax=Mucilaginibacter sp. TaxID=1882438 RepID=UPI0025F155E8|nr:DUF4038 domain-containing protein [Mucilaginibacter sp.]